MRLFLVFLLVVLPALLVGCAQPGMRVPDVDRHATQAEAVLQKRLYVEGWLRDRARLADVSFRVLRAGTPLCGERAGSVIGIVAHSAASVPESWRAAFLEVAGLRERASIVHVVPGSPAARAGLAARDVVLAVDGHDIPAGEPGLKALAERLKAQARSLTVARPGHGRITLRLSPARACAFSVEMTEEDAVNAYADGERILVTRGMMRFVDDDTELAMVLAHELAHDSLGHIDAKRQNALGGMLLGTVLDVLAAAGGVSTGGAFGRMAGDIGAQSFSKEFEAEADYVGMYILARAGYDIERAPNLWRRMALRDSKAIVAARTHPTSPERFVVMRRAIDEIRAKMAAGRPLMPERKSKPPAGPRAPMAAH